MFVDPLGPLSRVLIFLFTLVALVILGAIALSYAAHSFLVIVEDTAAGCDEIRWPDEPPTDWLWKPFYLAWLWAVPTVLAWLVFQACVPELLVGVWETALPLGTALWLLFPIFLFSSLSASRSWQIIHLGLLRRLLRRPIALAVYYFFSAIVLAGGGVLLVLGLWGASWWLPLAAPAAVVLFFIHARLMGRMAWLLGPGMVAPGNAGGKKKRPRRIRPLTSIDPWAVPEEEAIPTDVEEAQPDKDKGDPTGCDGADSPEEDEWTPNKKPYALMEEAPPAGGSSDKLSNLDEAPVVDGLSPFLEEAITARAPPAAGGHSLTEAVEQIFQQGRRILERTEPPAPRYPLISGVWTFPFYGATLRPLANLTIAGLLGGALLRLLFLTSPV